MRPRVGHPARGQRLFDASQKIRAEHLAQLIACKRFEFTAQFQVPNFDDEEDAAPEKPTKTAMFQVPNFDDDEDEPKK